MAAYKSCLLMGKTHMFIKCVLHALKHVFTPTVSDGSMLCFSPLNVCIEIAPYQGRYRRSEVMIFTINSVIEIVHYQGSYRCFCLFFYSQNFNLKIKNIQNGHLSWKPLLLEQNGRNLIYYSILYITILYIYI